MASPADTPIAPYLRPDLDHSQRGPSPDGVWDFAPDPHNQGMSERWQSSTKAPWSRRITVPFAWETAGSGSGVQWMPIGWHHRTIQAATDWRGQHISLHFGAVHYRATIWLNGESIGEHADGYQPFELDITNALDESGAGGLVVRVETPVDERAILHGKQRSLPSDGCNDCAFTASSGIWQPVWQEPLPRCVPGSKSSRASPAPGRISILCWPKAMRAPCAMRTG